MNAHTTFPGQALATPLRAVAAAIPPSLECSVCKGWVAEPGVCGGCREDRKATWDIHADVRQMRADIAAGRKVVTQYGIFTPDEIARAVHTEGGIVWPSSVGVSEFPL